MNAGFAGRFGTSHATSYGPIVAATAVGSDEELGPRWLDVSARKCLSGDRGGGGTRGLVVEGAVEAFGNGYVGTGVDTAFHF